MIVRGIYFSDADRLAWLGLFAAVCKRFNWVCRAYCQMTNHYHVVVETPEGNLAQGMRQLNGVYTQMVNRTHRRVILSFGDSAVSRAVRAYEATQHKG